MVTQQLTTTADDNELVLAEELGLRHDEIGGGRQKAWYAPWTWSYYEETGRGGIGGGFNV